MTPLLNNFNNYTHKMVSLSNLTTILAILFGHYSHPEGFILKDTLDQQTTFFMLGAMLCHRPKVRADIEAHPYFFIGDKLRRYISSSLTLERGARIALYRIVKSEDSS